MRIIDIREKTVALSSPARNAGISFDGMTASALAVVSDLSRHGRPLVGLAFDSIGRYGHGALLRERFAPRLLAAAPEDYQDETGVVDPAKAWSIVMRNEKPGGHGERSGAVGLIDAALWDLVAKVEEAPLWRVLARRFGGARDAPRVAVYASGGLYRPGDAVTELQDEMHRCLALGYRRVKIKIGGAPLGQDKRRIEAALDILGSGAALAVDCNGTLPLADAHALFAALDGYRLAWIEEPVDPLDFAGHAELASYWRTPIGTGENIFSAADTQNLLRHGGLRPDRDLLQMDVALSYGIVEYRRMLQKIEAFGWSRQRCLPHAGHFLALHVAAGLGLGGHEAVSDPDSLLGGFPPGVVVEDGFVRPGEAPGVGIEEKDNLYEVFRELLA